MAHPSDHLIDRRVLPIALERFAEDPVVLLEGPRSVGKSTLLGQIAAQTGAILLDLDDPATRDAVSADPATFVAGDQPVCVDEYQKAPVVLDAIKAELNRDGRPGRFVLTGSTRHDALPAAAQALTGRLSRLSIFPLAQTELDRADHNLVADLFGNATEVVANRPTSNTDRASYVDRAVTGGMPLALQRPTPASRARWFDNYVALTLERDVQQLRRIRQADLLPQLLNRLAGQTGQVLNIDKAGRDAGLDHTTAENYTRLLEAVFLIHRLPAWGKTLNARSAKSPKVHIVDSGVAARLLRLTPDKLLRRDATALTGLGHLIETFAVGELLRLTSWIDDVAGVGHWRTHDGDEVDFVTEHDDGALVAFEIKAAARVTRRDVGPLAKLRDATGDAFSAGVILYTGTRAYTIDDRLHALPLDRLWTQ